MKDELQQQREKQLMQKERGKYEMKKEITDNVQEIFP
jgi:flagellar basal body-associated protein FliL